jgi:hypothetical protein
VAPVFVAILSMPSMLRAGHGLRAQQEPAPAPASTVAAAPDPAPRTIRLEAITTDKLGAPITNLRAEDFSVLVDGVAQKLDSVEARSNAPARAGQPAIRRQVQVFEYSALKVFCLPDVTICRPPRTTT